MIYQYSEHQLDCRYLCQVFEISILYNWIIISSSSTTMGKDKRQEKMDVEEEQMVQEESVQSVMSQEDDDGDLLTSKVEEKLLLTMAKIKSKDPSIYQKKDQLYHQSDFQQQSEEVKQKTKIQKKKFTYKDMLQDKQSEDQDNLPLVQEEKRAKEKFKKALFKNIESLQNEKDDLFVVKQKLTKKSNEEPLDETAKFKQLTKKFNKQSKKLIRKVWNSDELDDTDLFLRDYILSKKWLSSKIKQAQDQEQQKIDEQDEQRSLQMDQYEAKYNFRFQQPGGTQIVQYPRKVRESLRQKPETRKEKRKRGEQQKKQQQMQYKKKAQQRKQELKRTILQRLAPQNEEQDHDWFFCDDCCKGLVSGETVYQCDKCQDFMLCIDCNELIIHKHPLAKNIIPEGLSAPEQKEQILQQLKSCKNCRRKVPPTKKRYEYTDKTYLLNTLCQACYDESNLQIKKKFKQVQPQSYNYEQILQKQPQKIKQLTNMQEIQQLVDEYIKNDFQDVIAGDIRTKFKYISVKPESYGLSDQQILFGDDKELNKYVSIKNLAAYRDERVKLRNNVFRSKIKSIKRSMKSNKQLLQKGQAKIAKMRYITKRKNRVLAIQKRLRKRVRVINLSTKQSQRNHFVSSSRLLSYGIQQEDNQA